MSGIAALVAVVTAACGGGDSPDEAAPAPATGEVTMRLIAFRPGNLTIGTGDTVTWTQKDAGVHTVTSGTVQQDGGGVTEMADSKFDSGEISTGKTFRFSFDEPGTYRYFCQIHPATMRGEIEVR